MPVTAANPASEGSLVHRWKPDGINDTSGTTSGAPPCWSTGTGLSWPSSEGSDTTSDMLAFRTVQANGRGTPNMFTVGGRGVGFALAANVATPKTAWDPSTTVPMLGSTRILLMRSPVNRNNSGTFTTATFSDNSASNILTALDAGFVNGFVLGEGLGKQLSFLTTKGGAIDKTINTGVYVQAGLEIVVIHCTAGGVMTVGVYRNGTLTSQSVSGVALSAGTGQMAHMFIGGDNNGQWPGVVTELVEYSAALTLNASGGAGTVQGQCEFLAQLYGISTQTFNPTRGLICMGTSETAGPNVVGGVTLSCLLASMGKRTGLVVANYGVIGASATSWNDATALGFINSAIASMKSTFPTIGSVDIQLEIGANEVIANTAAATFGTNYQSLVNAIRSTVTGFRKIHAISCPGIATGTPATTDAVRSSYDAKYLATTGIDNMILLSQSIPELVPEATSTKAVLSHAGGLLYQTPQNPAAGIAFPASSNLDGIFSGSTQPGSDRTHITLGNMILFSGLLQNPTYARAVGIAVAGMSPRDRRRALTGVGLN